MKKGDMVTKIKGKIVVVTTDILNKHFPTDFTGMHPVDPCGWYLGNGKYLWHSEQRTTTPKKDK